MKKLLGICLFVFAGFLPTFSSPGLRFNANGKFKIVQFTDVHYVPGNDNSKVALQTIQETIEAEHPDLVVFSGDVVTDKPAEQGWKTILGELEQRSVPFCVVLGNHDDEQNLSRKEISDLVKKYEMNVNARKDPPIKGVLNTVVEIKDAANKKNSFLLYCFDSNAYPTDKRFKGYGWFTADQIAWYRQMSAKYTRKNGRTPLPALAFFHIPLPEYREAFDQKENKRVGSRNESECSPELNSGMFAAMIESGDIIGTFVGHDHDNDYVVNARGIALGYGRFTGGKTTYTHMENGARIIELTQGERSFRTYVRLRSGEIKDDVCFPADFE